MKNSEAFPKIESFYNNNVTETNIDIAHIKYYNINYVCDTMLLDN